MRNALLAAAIGAAGMMLSPLHTASASIFTGSFDTIYSDNFAAPATNVNSSLADPNAIVGNAPAVSTGLDGGSAAATYIGIAQPAAIGATDAVWNYSGSNSATMTSPSPTNGEDANAIANLTLPLVPIVGKTYDLELTMVAAPGTGGHGLEMAFLYNNGNAHNTSVQAISNNDPVGLILDRDAVATAPNYFEIFENTGTGSDNSFAPSASALTGGTPGTTVTVDTIFTPTGTGTTGTMSWYLNGVLANPSPVNVTGLTGGVSFIQFGNNRDALGTFTNFSLTAIPEPASLALLAVSGLLVARRRQA
jgi:hypothetical protein